MTRGPRLPRRTTTRTIWSRSATRRPARPRPTGTPGPWRPGVILQQVGEDEWLVLVEDISLPALDGDELVYPTCFRDASEIRRWS